MTAHAGGQAPARAGHYRLADVARMEWLKLRSLRSSRWLALITAASLVGIGIAVLSYYPAHWAHLSAANKAAFDPTNQGFTGMALAQLVAGIAGVLMITGEYSSGSIRATLAAVPRRPVMLAAKALVLGASALLIGEVTCVATFVVDQDVVLRSVPVHTSLTQAAPLRVVLMLGGYFALMALLGLGLGAIVRHTAGAIAAVVGVTLALQAIFALLPTSVRNGYGRYLPMIIAENSLGSVKPSPDSLPPWPGLLLLCGYVAVTLVLGGWLLARRDA